MRCSACGAALAPGAGWCGQCFAPADATPAYAPAAVAAPVAAAPAPPPWDAAAARAAMAGRAAVPAWTPEPPAPHVPLPPVRVDLPVPAQPSRGAGWTTLVAIGVGALMSGGLSLLTRGSVVENEAMVRYAIVGTLATYLVVTLLVLRQVNADGHPLRWRGNWPVLPSVALGLAAGGGLAYLLLQAAEGGDESLALLVSEGDAPHVLAAFLIAVVAAPVVEEVLFRGLLLQSLTGSRSVRGALWLSSFAFAAWHLDPTALRYYSLAGAFLGGLYLSKGLSCSIAAHAAFNGTLVVAAVSYALAAGPVVRYEGLTMATPHGWHSEPSAEGTPYLRGPSGGEVGVYAAPSELFAGRDTEQLLTVVRETVLPQAEADAATLHREDLPAGEAARVRVRLEGHDGELVLLPTKRQLYLFLLVSGGSPRVRADFDEMLEAVRVR